MNLPEIRFDDVIMQAFGVHVWTLDASFHADDKTVSEFVSYFNARFPAEVANLHAINIAKDKTRFPGVTYLVSGERVDQWPDWQFRAPNREMISIQHLIRAYARQGKGYGDLFAANQFDYLARSQEPQD